MFKKFFTKMALKSQLKDMPKDQQETVMKAIEENPEFFENIAKEIEQKQKEGKSQMAAAMEVMRKHQSELMRIMGQPGAGGQPGK